MEKYANLTARILVAQLFLLAGFSKITGYSGTQSYMEAMGVPGVLLPLVILLEVGGGLALILGWQTRIISLALAGFTLLAAFIFHSNFADQMQMIMFMKNIAITGGLLAISVQDVRHSIGIDHWRLAAH
jgi:putative oxidoreductase